MTSVTADKATRKLPFIEFSDEEKRRLVVEAVAQDYKLRGDNLPFLKKASDIIGYADSTLALSEVAGLLAEGAVTGSVASATSFLAALLFPAGALLAAVDAREAGVRMYGMRAVAYTITAWSFGDPVPTESRAIMANLQSGFPRLKSQEVAEFHAAWRKASTATIQNLHSTPVRKGILESSLRVFYRSVGDDSRQTLCRMLLEGFEKQLSGAALQVWRSNYKVLFPL